MYYNFKKYLDYFSTRDLSVFKFILSSFNPSPLGVSIIPGRSVNLSSFKKKPNGSFFIFP